MIRWRDGVVRGLRRNWPGAVELEVEVRNGGGSDTLPALAYTDLVGELRVGDRVLLNTAAYDRGLGTGGYALVVAVPDRLPPDRLAGGRAESGHLVKARYSPLQVMLAGADEQGTAGHDVLRDADDLAGMPVLVADLHSALPAVLAGVYESRPDARVAYVMTDGAALPLAFSRTVAGLRSAEWLVGTITVGQAYGGDLEATTTHTGLLAARLLLNADLAVVIQGPGNLGTGTRWGFSGVAAGENVNAAAALNGRPVCALRVSQADPRPRHQGVSHHNLTAYGRVALCSADVVVPEFDEPLGTVVRDAVAPLSDRHRLVTVKLDGLSEALEDCPVTLSSMGRGSADDPAYFLANAAAGRYAATLLP